jgi:hypothetical protein
MDGELRACLKYKSEKQSKNFSWAKTAHQILQAYVDVLKMPKQKKE